VRSMLRDTACPDECLPFCPSRRSAMTAVHHACKDHHYKLRGEYVSCLCEHGPDTPMAQSLGDTL